MPVDQLYEAQVGYKSDAGKYGWNNFLSLFCDAKRTRGVLVPHVFKVGMLSSQSEFIDRLNILEPWQLILMYDASNLAHHQMENVLKENEFDAVNRVMTFRREDVRNKLQAAHEIEIYDIDHQGRSTIKEVLQGTRYWSTRLRILKDPTLNDKQRISLAKSIGIKIDIEEVVPSDLPSREEWLYKKTLDQLASKKTETKDEGGNQKLEDAIIAYTLSKKVYQTFRDGELLKPERKKELAMIQEADALIHSLIQKKILTMTQDGRHLESELFFKLNGLSGIDKKAIDRILILSKNLAAPERDLEKLTNRLLQFMDESVERVSLEYLQRNAELPVGIRSDNPGALLNYGIILSPASREFLITSEKLNLLYRAAIKKLMQKQSTDDEGRLKIEFARTILGKPLNFIRWRGGEKAASLDPIAFGKYS